MRLLVMMPCLNEAATISNVIQAIPRKIRGIEKVDVVVINDGSTDDSEQVARQAGAEVISHKVNQGVGRAFQSGLNFALNNNYDMMVNIDSDGQFSPNDIPKLVNPILEGKAEFVTASRFLSGKVIPHMSSVKLWGNHKMSKLISKLANKSFTDVSCGFRAYSKETLMRLTLHGQFTYTQETFLDLAFKNIKMVEIPIDVKYFPDRQSRVARSILNYAYNTSLIIFRTYRDYQPLKFFWAIAAVFATPGVLLLSFLLSWYITQGSFTPHIWAGFLGGSLMAVSLLFFIVGIFADMLDRIRANQEEILYKLRKSS